MKIIYYIFISAFITGLALQAFYFIQLWRARRAPAGPAPSPPVRVIIAARNEVSNLKKNIPLILEQDHRDFRVLVADDGSDDGSAEWLSSLSRQFPNLEFFTVDRSGAGEGKKRALTQAIQRCKEEYLIFTDADCCPAARSWLTMISSHFSAGKELILGVSPVETRPGLFNRFIRFETFYTAIQYLSGALAGHSYMG